MGKPKRNRCQTQQLCLANTRNHLRTRSNIQTHLTPCIIIQCRIWSKEVTYRLTTSWRMMLRCGTRVTPSLSVREYYDGRSSILIGIRLDLAWNSVNNWYVALVYWT